MRFSRVSVPGRLREWYNLPFGSIVIDEDVALSEDDQRDVVGRLKEVIRPFTLQRTADWVFRIMTEQKIIWLPMSPWQKVVSDERRAGIGPSVFGRCFGLDSLFTCFRSVPPFSLSLRLIANREVYDAVREKDVERWAGILGKSGLNNLSAEWTSAPLPRDRPLVEVPCADYQVL